MKLTELRCESCNGPLKIDENDSKLAVCEYCGMKYVLDDKKTGSHDAPGAETPWYVTPAPPPENSRRDSGWGRYGWKWQLTAILVSFAVILIICVPRMVKKWETDHAAPKKTEETGKVTETGIKGGNIPKAEDISETEAGFTGVFAEAAAIAFGKPLEELPTEELAKVKWLEFKYSEESLMVGYSFQNPLAEADAALEWLEFPRDTAQTDMSAISFFSGLKVLNVAGRLTAEDVKGLKLESLGCYGESPKELAQILGNTEQLKELKINAGLKSLDGLDAFQGLERLLVEGSSLTDLMPLVNLKGLKALSLADCDKVSDFSFLSVMDWLEELSVDSEALKDTGFVKNMARLQTLSIVNAGLLNLNGLEGKNSLTSLTVDGCSNMADAKAVQELTGLTRLTLEVPYGCAGPDLSRLTGLLELHIEGMGTVGFLGQMQELETLSLRSCTIDDLSVFSGLRQLRSLSCSYMADETDWGFAAAVPGLETLELSGIVTYRDISGLFNIPTLKELNISGMECEIAFSRLAENETLETLRIDGVKLYTNIQEEISGAVRSIDYDEVLLDEHLDFLKNYPGLKHLTAADNKLTHVDSLESLKNLETLDISNNYVTDIKALSSLRSLHTLKCAGNPVENYRVLSEDVTVIK